MDVAKLTTAERSKIRAAQIKQRELEHFEEERAEILKKRDRLIRSLTRSPRTTYQGIADAVGLSYSLIVKIHRGER